MESILVDCNIKVDNITVFQWSVVWNTVANDFIDGSGIMIEIYVQSDFGNL